MGAGPFEPSFPARRATRVDPSCPPHCAINKFWRIADDPARCGIAVELKADAASVLTGVIHAPSDLGKKATTVLSLKPYSLRAAEITAQKQAAAIFRNVLRQDLIDKRRRILIPASYR